jgi:hypothetical protein
MYLSVPKPKYNVRYLGQMTQGLRTHPSPDDDAFKEAQAIVKKAIKTHAPQIADKAINGFRRSTGDDKAALINFLKADVPKFNIKKDEHYERALRVTEKLFRPRTKLRPVAFPDLRYYPWNLRTSAEAPYNAKDKWFNHCKTKHSLGITKSSARTFHNLYDEIFQKNRTLVHLIKERNKKFFDEQGKPKPYYWHSLHTRAHLVKADEPDKNRAVFGTPKLLLQVENMFIWPMTKEYLNNERSSPMLWGYETFRGGWKRLYQDIFSTSNPNSFLGMDWSGFDRLASFEVIDDVHKIWKSYFEFDKGYWPTNQYDEQHSYTNPDKLQALWDWFTHCVKYTPSRAHYDGGLYQFTWNGIASGFQETQILDSFVNCIMILTCLSALGVNIESDDFIIKVQGDDSLVTFPERYFDKYGTYFLTMLEKEAKIRFNAILNVKKSKFSDHLTDIDVLSYRNRNGKAYRDDAELLAQLLYPERYRTFGAFASASVGIAQASMGNSKLVYNVCKDVWTFLVNKLKVEPRPIKFNYLGLAGNSANVNDFVPTRFPSLLEIKDQQYFQGKDRTRSEKERLWPTEPNVLSTEHPKGFYFLSLD